MKKYTLFLIALMVVAPTVTLFAQEDTATEETPVPTLLSEEQESTGKNTMTMEERRQMRQERREDIQERRASRRYAIAERISEKLENLYDRITHISGRIQLAIDRFADRGVDTSESQASFDMGITHLADAEGSIMAVVTYLETWNLEDMTVDELKERISEEQGEFRSLVNAARDDLKEAREAFKEAIRTLKASGDDAVNDDEDAEEDSEDGDDTDSNEDTSEE